ncbi:MAG: M55 family metallopeptidase [Fimbriimonadaceae bacterium]|nr:M55 family metallopeptidase [Fimbriimonadaceae bacterium]
MKVFMLWDMEGVSGLWRREEVWYWEPGVEPADETAGKALLMADINNAVVAALEAGVEELIVCDTHRGGGNIDLAQMHQDPRVTWLPRSRGEVDGRLRWLPGLDEQTAGIFLPGHHAKAGTRGAFLPHTWMGEWADVRLNGESVGELGIEACFAGHFGVPLAFMQGDEAACREATAQFPGVVTAAVKRAISRDRASGLAPADARELTATKVRQAVAQLRVAPPPPFCPSLPLTVTIRYRSTAGAEQAAARPGVVRVDRHTVEKTVPRLGDVMHWIAGAGL